MKKKISLIVSCIIMLSLINITDFFSINTVSANNEAAKEYIKSSASNEISENKRYFIESEGHTIELICTENYGSRGNLYVDDKLVDSQVLWSFFSNGQMVYYIKQQSIYAYNINTLEKAIIVEEDDTPSIEGIYGNKYLYYCSRKYVNVTNSLQDLIIFDLENQEEVTYVNDVGQLVMTNENIYTTPCTGSIAPLPITELDLDGSNPKIIAYDATSMTVINNKLLYASLNMSDNVIEHQIKEYDHSSTNITELTEYHYGYVTDIYLDYAIFNDNGDVYQVDYKRNISVVLNGEKIEFDQLPIMLNDRVMVPIRPVAEAMGDTVKWCGYLNSALIIHSDKIVMFTNDKSNVAMYKDPLDVTTWSSYTCDVPPQNINGRTLTPVRAIAECLGATVDWDSSTQTVYINYNKPTLTSLNDNAFSQLNAYYFSMLQMSDFSTYTQEINDFYNNRDGWSDAFIIFWDDWSISLDILLSGEQTDVYMIKNCFADILSDVPDSNIKDFGVYTETLDWLNNTTDLLSSGFSKIGGNSKFSVSTARFINKLGEALDTSGTIIDFSSLGVELLAEMLSDYSTGMLYINTLRESMRYAGIQDDVIYTALDELEKEYINKYLNFFVENAADMGSGKVIDAITGGVLSISEFGKDVLNKFAGNDDKAEAVKNLNCIYLFNDYIDEVYDNSRTGLTNRFYSAFADEKRADPAIVDEFIVLFNLQKTTKIKMYEAMDELRDTSDEYTELRIKEQLDNLNNTSYIIWE